MALKIDPRSELDNMVVGEECAYELDVTKELGSKTINSYTYKVYDSSDIDVTSTFGGGKTISSGVITFGVKAVSVGKYTLQFIVTCNELLPDGTTPYEFYVTMTVTIEKKAKGI